MGNLINRQASEGEKNVLPKHLGGGPMNLGDPDDRHLRKVEKDVLILKMVREIVHSDKCYVHTQALDQCGRREGILAAFKCREERDKVYECSKRWFEDEGLRSECTEEYLRQRSYYRRTGRPGYLYKQEDKRTEQAVK